MAVDKRKRKFKTLRVFIMVFIITGICTVLYYNYLNLEKQHTAYAKELEEAKQKKAEQEQRKKNIDNYKAYVQTKQFAEEVARKKFGLVYEDEIIFKVGDETEQEQSTIVEEYDAQFAQEQAEKKEKLEKEKAEHEKADQSSKPSDNKKNDNSDDRNE